MGSTGVSAGMTGGTVASAPIPKSQVSVSSRAYEGSYGRSPRGAGTWIFFTDSARNDFDNAITVSGSYASAKKQAIEEAAKRGKKNLYLGT